MTTDTPDNTDAAYGIIARKRVWAINDGRLPTVEDYHAALVQCLKDKPGEIERLRLTQSERWLLEMLADHPATHQIMPHEVATLRGVLERLT